MGWGLNDLFDQPADFAVGPGFSSAMRDAGDDLNGLGNSLNNIYNFASSEADTMWDEVSDDPMALELNRNPMETRASNWLFNRDQKPLRNNYMLSSEQAVKDAQSKGLDTNAALTAQAYAGNIAKGFLNAYTFGLGGTALDAMDRKYFKDSTGRNDTLSRSQFGTNLAMSQAPSFDTGYGAFANGVANGYVKGGISSELQGNDWHQGANKGAIAGGVSGGATQLQNYMSNTSDAPQIGSGSYEDSSGEVQHDPSISTGTNMSDTVTPSQDYSYSDGGNWGNFSNILGKYFMPSSSGKSGEGTGIDWGNAASGLLSMYNANRQMRNYQGQIGNLQGLFSENSPYAQVMQRQLAAKDAASGRRSQYGPREVELQARLAQLASQQAPTLNALYGGANKARTDMLRSGLTGLQNAGVFKGLGNIFQQQQVNPQTPYGDTLYSASKMEPNFFGSGDY